MAEQLQEFDLYNSQDYIVWDEKSMRDLLIRFLSKSGVYTDQVFPGSDLSVMIDLVSYAFAQLTYIANHNAAEATFTDAQFYENMNRLAKMLGYNPRGFISSSVECRIVIKSDKYMEKFPAEQSMVRGLPRYSTYKLGNTQYSLASGEAGLSYSDYQQFSFAVDYINHQPVVTNSENPVFINGKWKLYPVQLVATGEQNETFILDQTDDLIAFPFIDIYVFTPETGKYERWLPVQQLFDQGMTDQVYSIRLNEFYRYELTFGDGVNGARLQQGQVLYAIYLKTYGAAGAIDVGAMNGSGKIYVEIEGLTGIEVKNICFGSVAQFNSEFDLFNTVGSEISTNLVSLENLVSSSASLDYETVESIRSNAPNAFRRGSRVVTASDYEDFTMENYANAIRNCKVMNNYEYCSVFQGYLLRYGKLSIDIRRYSYRFSDACDDNNVYVWLRSTLPGQTSEFVKRALLNDLMNLKCLNAEPIPMDALAVVFSPYAGGEFDTSNWDPANTNRFLVVKDQTSLVNNDRIKEAVVEKIINFFSPDNQPIGGIVSLQKLYNDILALNGVKDVQTIYVVGNVVKATVSGMSFTYWTPLILRGADRGVANLSPVKMEPFQYAELRKANQINQLVQVSSTNHFITTPEY